MSGASPFRNPKASLSQTTRPSAVLTIPGSSAPTRPRSASSKSVRFRKSGVVTAISLLLCYRAHRTCAGLASSPASTRSTTFWTAVAGASCGEDQALKGLAGRPRRRVGGIVASAPRCAPVVSRSGQRRWTSTAGEGVGHGREGGMGYGTGKCASDSRPGGRLSRRDRRRRPWGTGTVIFVGVVMTMIGALHASQGRPSVKHLPRSNRPASIAEDNHHSTARLRGVGVRLARATAAPRRAPGPPCRVGGAHDPDR